MNSKLSDFIDDFMAVPGLISVAIDICVCLILGAVSYFCNSAVMLGFSIAWVLIAMIDGYRTWRIYKKNKNKTK